MQRVIPRDLIEGALQQHGMNGIAAAEAIGCYPSSVYRYRRKAHPDARHSPHRGAIPVEIIKMAYEACGWSPTRTAAAVGCSKQHVAQTAARQGWPRRPRFGAKK